MRACDLDWRAITNGWPREDLVYVRAVFDEKIAQMDVATVKRRTLIRAVD